MDSFVWIWDGGLRHQTDDGWQIEEETLDWPVRTYLLKSKDQIGALDIQKPFDATVIERDSDIIAFGFSWLGVVTEGVLNRMFFGYNCSSKEYRNMPKKSAKKSAKKAVKKSVKKKVAKKSSRRDPVVLAFDEAEDFTISVVGQDGQPVPNRMAMEKMMGRFAKKLEMLAAEHGGSLDGFDSNELAAILNGMPMQQADSPVDQAREIVFEAFEARSSKKRIELANKALKIDPDCVDALILLAEETGKTRRSLIDQYRKAVAAGERSLGKKFIEENTGYFWSMHETRPYMRALEGLAANLRADGYMIESLDTYRKMLILNPGDNQGVRYQALYLLIEADQEESAEELYESYSDDGSAWWNFGRALLDFRKSGDTPKTRKTLREAIKENPFVPQYLLEIKERPSVPPGHYGIGDENEAMYYYDSAIRAWFGTGEAAYDWLLDVSKEFFE